MQQQGGVRYNELKIKKLRGNKMDFKAIKKLIDLVQDSGISELSIEENDTKIEIKKGPSGQHVTVPIQAEAPAALPMAAAPVAPAAEVKPENDPNIIEIKAQMVGTFYTSASPEAAAYVKVGSSISEGQILCIIEAMKLFNEIESEISGTIEKICLNTGDSVEFGQTLFLVKKG